MPSNVTTCPNCGALITAQLTRCRQCKTYLHGTKLEGVLFEHLLPKRLAASPGTGLIGLILVLYYVLMVVLAGPKSLVSFTYFSSGQLGSTFSPGVFQGQYWRFVTSVLGHGDIVHIAFNLYALSIVGPIVEELYDRKKMIFMFVITGVLSMMVSFGFNFFVSGERVFSSVGASGGICGLVGVAWLGANKVGNRQIAHSMRTWAIYLAIFGFLVSGIDNAAHAGGFAVGAGLVQVMPLGLTQRVATQRVLSVVLLGCLVLFVASTAAMLTNLHGYPASLAEDLEPTRVFMFTVSPGRDPRYSSQQQIVTECMDAAREGAHDDAAIKKCEMFIRAGVRSGAYREGFLVLATMHERRGNLARAETLRRVATLLRDR